MVVVLAQEVSVRIVPQIEIHDDKIVQRLADASNERNAPTRRHRIVGLHFPKATEALVAGVDYYQCLRPGFVFLCNCRAWRSS